MANFWYVRIVWATIVCALGGPSSFLFGPPYSQVGELRGTAASPLDQLDVAAGADLRVIQQWAERMQFRPAIEALEIFQGEWSLLRRRVLKSEPSCIFGRRGRQATSEKWKNHIQSLHGWVVSS